jgi:hypothetical protein
MFLYGGFSYVQQILPFSSLCRRLIQIKIAFAMKITKVHGQRLKRVGIYLPSPFRPTTITHGQLHVAFSQTRSFEKAAFVIIEGYRQCTENDRLITSNIMYPKVL